MARPKKNPSGDAGATGEGGSTQTTGSSGNARHRAQKRTLSSRIQSLETKIDRLGTNMQRIARGVS
jgi:outer membrane murein-binding lipoprotein Lpp